MYGNTAPHVSASKNNTDDHPEFITIVQTQPHYSPQACTYIAQRIFEENGGARLYGLVTVQWVEIMLYFHV